MRTADLLTAPIQQREISRQLCQGVYSGLAKGLKTEHISFEDYIQQAWPIIQPATAFVSNWHIGAVAEYFQAVILGQITRLIVNLYPRLGKSLIFSVLGPTWAWTERPWLEQIFLSYSQRLATDFSRDRRALIESAWYQEKWGNVVQLAPDQNQKNEFDNTARGGMYSTSVGGTLTGKGGDLIVIDDGIDPERAESKADREAAIRFVKNVVSSRLNDPKRGAIIEVSQRTHKNDISGTLLSQGDYVHLCLPAIAEKKTVIEFPISKKKHIREEGDVLFPQRHDKETIEKMMRSMTPRAAKAQMMQNPSSDENAVFRRDLWKYYEISPEEMAKNCSQVIQSWDMTFKDSLNSDYVAGGVIGKRGPDFMLLNVTRKRMGFGASKMAVKQTTAAWPMAHKKLIEGKANGPAIIEELKREIGGIEEFIPTDSKEARAAVVAPYQESGNLWLPNPQLDGCGWVKDFVDELEDFGPTCEHDDQVDMFTQAIIWFLNKSRHKPGLFVPEE